MTFPIHKDIADIPFSIPFTNSRRFTMSPFHQALLGLLITMSVAPAVGWSADTTPNTSTAYQDAAGDVTYVRIPLPTAPAETVPTSLTATQAWIPGHWARQNGVFFWRAGLVVEKPSPNVHWEAAAWVHVATRHHGWRYHPGRWVTG